ncbi:hypothetical protein NHX12_006807 [Muraenolepis orangiensis]|uniref:Uncharacterized protein n=1 Tax=Muraenolepis orangiensis TaxID=630683 RepID=A0A9Q0DMZ0_9TELE|nr:hypothetical protein NHX12_006807 [Muraenolepis orangiensis]
MWGGGAVDPWYCGVGGDGTVQCVPSVANGIPAQTSEGSSDLFVDRDGSQVFIQVFSHEQVVTGSVRLDSSYRLFIIPRVGGDLMRRRHRRAGRMGPSHLVSGARGAEGSLAALTSLGCPSTPRDPGLPTALLAPPAPPGS